MFQVITFAHVLQYLQQFITAPKSLQTTKCTLLGPQATNFPPRPVDICQTLYTDSAIQLPLVTRPSQQPSVLQILPYTILAIGCSAGQILYFVFLVSKTRQCIVSAPFTTYLSHMDPGSTTLIILLSAWMMLLLY